MKKKSLLLMLLMALLVPWAANAQETLTVYGDNTTTNEYVPIYGYYADSKSKCEFIIPSEKISAMNGSAISAMKFYLDHSDDGSYYSTISAPFEVFVKEVSATTLSGFVGNSGATTVFNGTITIGLGESGLEIDIPFSSDYIYSGGNLLVGFYQTTTTGYNHTYWTGETQTTNTAWGGYVGSASAKKFLPKTTFTYELVTTPTISLPATATVKTGLTTELTATLMNVTGTPTIIYSSSNSKVASVTGSGTTATVTGVSAGTATITATMVYNATNYYATCDVTVEDPSYCTPSFSYTSDYIESFTTTGGEQNIDNQNSGQGTGGYSNFYDTYFVSAEPETEIGFSVVRGYSDTYNYAIWVDWNKDYEFDNTTEKVAYTSSSTGDWSGSFTIPAATAAGDYHMRVLQIYTSYTSNVTPCASASYGEGEDYKLTVLAGNPYQKPVNLQVSALTAHEATISWTAPNTNVQSYKYQYKEEGGEWSALKSTTATEAPLTGLTAETHHIFQVQAIYAGGNESTFASIEFDTEIACAAPTNLAASNITDEGATLSWDGSATSYNVRYRAQKGFHYDFEQAQVWTYDNFPPCTTYDGDGVQCYGFSGETYTNFPFIGSTFAFQSQGGNLSSHSGDVFGLMVCPNDASAADDWFILPAITIANGDVFQFYAREITNQYGDETINVGIYGDTPGTFAEVIDADVAIGETVYTLHSYDLSAYAGQTIRLAINYVSTDIFGFMFDDIFVGDPNDNTWDVTENKVTSPYPIVGLTELTTYDFEVQADCGGGETSSWVATSFTTLPSCMPVSNLAVSDITTTTVGLTWEDNNGGTASYIVTDGDDNPMTVTNLTVTGCTVTGLIANTLYTFKVSAGCGSTTVSIQARTECDVITTLPYDEGFETVTYYCWALDGFSGLNNSTYAHTGNMSIFADGSSTDPHQIILPETNDDIDGLMLNFWYYNYNSGIDCGTLYVGYVTDPDDFTTFTEVGSIDMSSGINTYAQSQDFVFTGAPAGSRMAIDYDASGETYAYVMIDDARIDIAPNCVKPYDLLVYDETTHGATFEWTSNGSETEWHLYVSTENNAPADDINLKEVTVADSNPFTLTTGLDAETDYYVWVRASCGGTDGYSTWVGPETFTTDVACPAPTGLAASEITGHTAKLSWTGTSDSYNVWYRTAATMSNPIFSETFETSSLPTGWGRSSTALTDDVLNGTTTINSYSGGWVNTSYGLGQYNWKMNIYSTGKYWLITPSITLDAKNTLNFDAAITAYNSNNAPTSSNMANANSRFVVLITTDNQATWTILREWNNTGSADVLNNISNTGNNFSIDLTAYAGETVKIAFYGGQTSSGPDCDLHIDNVVIGTPVEAGEWTKKTADASPYVATVLLAETKYEAKVQGNCGSEGLSQWTSSVFFTTDIACPAPTALAASNPTSSSFDLQWTNGGSEDWVLAYKVDGAADFTELDLNVSDVTEEAGTISYTLGGLDAETDYIVKVRDNCEASVPGDGVSAWTAEVTYSTIAACSALNPVVSEINHYTATVNFEGESASGFTVKYREAAYIDGIGEEFSGTSVPTDWTLYTGMVDNVIAGTATMASTNYGWTMTTSTPNVFNSNHIRLNIYGTSRNHWLVTPEIDLAANSGLSFDLALTAYSSYGTSTSAASGTCDDDRFVVLIYANDAWSILREWNNSGSSDVYNDIATAGENVQIDLSSYSGTVKIAFYGESTTSGNGDNDMHLDNVIIGVTVPAATTWHTQAATGTTANLSGLTAGTKYDVKVVPNCDPTVESGIATFTTLSSDKKYFLTAGNWGTASNWMDSEIPGETDNVIIRANVNVEPGCVAMANNITFEGATTPTITIKDGGQLKHTNAVTATLEKSITGYGDPSNPGGWYLIATPVSSTYITTNFSGTFDLYKYNEPDYMWYTWNTSVSGQSFTYLYRNTGYLYAHDTDTQLSFTGEMMGTKATTSKSLSYTSSLYQAHADVIGFNLIGNPFTRNLVDGDMTIGGGPLTSYYVINPDGDALVQVNSDAYQIKPGEGFFVQAGGSGQSVVFNPSSKDAFNVAYIKIVAGNEDGYDNACIQIEEGNTLRKMNIAKKTSVYVIDNGDDYAAATIHELAGTMPVHFNAIADGEFTITVNTKNIEASTLLLFDNFKNETIDLLETPTYSFKSSADDPENRFKLIFDFNNNNNYNGVEDNFTNGNFVYQSGDELIVNGEGELQIFDVLGRLVTSKNISGVERVSKPAQTGVYIFRLNEHTQKLIIK